MNETLELGGLAAAESAHGFSGLLDALSAAGGSLALGFIVALIVGLVAMAVVFVGSSIVVLDRFARVARRPGWVALAAFAVAASIAAVVVREQMPELSVRPFQEWLDVYLGVLARGLVTTAVACGVVALALRRVGPERLARIAVLWLSLAVALYAGAILRAPQSFAPMAMAGLLAAALAWRRTRAARDGAPAASAFERDVRLATLVLATAPALALAPPDAGPELASVGAGLAALFLSLVVFGLLPLAVAGLVELRRGAEWFIAVRYLVARRRQVFISAITAICVAGIAAGVWLIITVLSVMNGFERTWREEIIGNRAHFTVHSGFGAFGEYDGVLRTVESIEGVTAVSPYLDAEGMVRSRHGEIYAVRLRGVDPARVASVTDLRDDLRSGSLEALAAPVPDEDGGGAPVPGILIGHQLATTIGAGVGDELLLISPYGGAPTPLGPAPRLARFRVAGVFQSSFFQYDEVYTYTSLAAAQEFRKSGDVVDGLEARTTDFYRSRQVAAEVVRALEYPFYTRDWKEYFPAFFQALKTERVMMFILLSMVMVVAAFSIVATLIMMIMEKSSDIAILKAMGAEDASIERIFALEGTLIGLAGTSLGVLAGIAVTTQLDWVQRQIEVVTGIDTLPAEIYQFSTLPSEVNPVDVLVIVTIAMVLSLGATLLPSRQGSRVDPVEGLRHE